MRYKNGYNFTKEYVKSEIVKNNKQIIGIKAGDMWTIEGEIGEIKNLDDTGFDIMLNFQGQTRFMYKDIKYIDDQRENLNE